MITRWSSSLSWRRFLVSATTMVTMMAMSRPFLTTAAAFGYRSSKISKNLLKQQQQTTMSNYGAEEPPPHPYTPVNNKNTGKKKRKARIKANEKVVFFPTAGRRSADGTSWDIPIHGWIFEPETRDPARRAFVTSLRKYLKLARNSEETAILKRRLGPFLVDNERRKELSIQIGCDRDHDDCRIFPLPRSGKNGHFEAMLTLGDEELHAIQEVCCTEDKTTGHANDATLHYRAVMEENDERCFQGVAHLIPQVGWSVISDIDDTVKVTGVGDKRALLKSTFMQEFQEVPGMAALYQRWEHELNAKFHFVSSSPWQLWEELEQFLSRVGFPEAAYHLKPIRLKDRTLLNLWKCPLETKIAVIESILDAFPHRKFLLVGDTGEKDPEVYGEVARHRPHQIGGIYVRNVTNETRTDERYAEAFEGVDPEIWTLFDDPQDVELSPAILEYKFEEPVADDASSSISTSTSTLQP